MTTDPYAETDDWPTAPATRPSSDAQPVSAPEPSGSTPEAGEAARVAAYAEAIQTTVRGHHPRCFLVRPEGIPDHLPRDLCDCRILWMLTAASEHQRAEAAEADAALLRSETIDAHAALDRAEAESARLASVVAKVEALADEWTAEADRLQEFADRHQGYYQGIVGARRTCRDDLRAALASVAPDTATPGEADGAALIAAERQRQIDAEGYTPEHDWHHSRQEFVDAAEAYLTHASGMAASECLLGWPWDAPSFKPSDTRRDLVKAGALIAAAIDRRAASSADDKAGE